MPIIGIAFQRDVYRRSCVDDALVKDGHLTSIIVYAIVYALCESYTSGCNHDRALRHVVGSERDDVGTGAAVLSGQEVFILLGNLLGNGFGRAVEFGKTVGAGYGSRNAFGHKIVVEIGTKGFCLGNEDASVGYGIALDKVEIAVSVCPIVIVQAVGS